MYDNTVFPNLKVLQVLERALFEDSDAPNSLIGFHNGINEAFDRIGFTNSYVEFVKARLATRMLSREEIETTGFSVSKVVKDIIWGMIELDPTSVVLLDSPVVQRLRYIRQNGFTYLVYPAATHVRLQHSLGVLAVVSKYISSINASAARPERFADELVPKPVPETLALDLKHAAILHDIGHFPLSHVLEAIFESDPTSFKIGGSSVRDFEICFMSRLKDQEPHLSEMLSIAIVLSRRFRDFYTALRQDSWAYLRVACLISGMPLSDNIPGYSQLISGAVDCDKVDYILRDSAMSNVPVAIDQARLFLNSALIECRGDKIRKLCNKGVLSGRTKLDEPAVTLVLNSSGVDTIEEVAFARATLFEGVYRHPVTRNAERILSVAICGAVASGSENESWRETLTSFTATDDTFMDRLLNSNSAAVRDLSLKLRLRQLPKRAFAFSPDFYAPVVPYVSIFSELSPSEAASRYYHEVTSKDPFHDIVLRLKEGSAVFGSNEQHLLLERRIADEATAIARNLRGLLANAPDGNPSAPDGSPRVFFVPLPNHSALQTSCAIVTREGELESSRDYSRASQLLIAKEIGRSVGFVMCDPEWAEIVFLASQNVLYDYFGNDVGQVDLDLQFKTPSEDESDGLKSAPKSLRLNAVKRFYIAEDLAIRRSRLDRRRLTSYRSMLSQLGYYDRKPRLAEVEQLTAPIEKLANSFREFSGQHGWRVTVETLRQFLNQFPPRFREEAKNLLGSFNFLNREKASELLGLSLNSTVDEIRIASAHRNIHLVPLAGTSAHMMLELSKQENRQLLKRSGLKDYRSVHEMLGVAKPEDVVVFVDDNISSGTQFSAQLLKWVGLQQASPDSAIRAEDGIEAFELPPNAKELLAQLEIRLATCVGKKGCDASVRTNFQFTNGKLNFRGLKYGEELAQTKKGQITSEFRTFLEIVGTECIRYTKGLDAADDDCRSKALGYGNSEGRTVTLWNVPTSTFTAFWCPGIIDGEPWFPLFIRRGYAEKLVVA
jgi:HD superfamily phosphohydrolase